MVRSDNDRTAVENGGVDAFAAAASDSTGEPPRSASAQTPLPLLTDPLLHGTHAEAPTDTVVSPEGHAAQTPDASSKKKPSGHGSHAPPATTKPGRHASHEALYPASHPLQNPSH